MAQEKLQQLSIQAAGVGSKFVDLQPRLDIEVIADVAILKIQIDETNRTLARALVGFQLHPGLDRQSRIADPACAGDEGGDRRLATLRLRRSTRGHPAPEDVRDLLRGITSRDPIARARLQKTLVMTRGNLIVTDENDEAEFVILDCDIDEVIERRSCGQANGK